MKNMKNTVKQKKSFIRRLLDRHEDKITKIMHKLMDLVRLDAGVGL